MSRSVDLMAGADVPVQHVVGVTVDDLDLVVWRAGDGVVCVMDARCPHQWSHLAAEGTVVGQEILCLAHFWRFDTDGHGVKEAMNGRRDPKSDITVYESTERDGRIIARLPAA